MAFYRWDGPDLILSVRVQPNARRSRFVVDPRDDGLKVQVAAAAIEGRANEALIAFLAEQFGVPRRQVLLEHGAGSRRKRLRIQSPRRLPPELDLGGQTGTGFA